MNLKFLQERLQFTINELGQKVSEILAASCSSDLTDRINRIKKCWLGTISDFFYLFEVVNIGQLCDSREFSAAGYGR